MRREEAIKWIDALSIYLSMCDDQSLKDSLSSDIEKTIKALDIAVEALNTLECSQVWIKPTQNTKDYLMDEY